MIDANNFEYVLNIASVFLLLASLFLCYLLLESKHEREKYNLLFFIMSLLLAGQLLNVLARFKILVVPGGSALTYFAISAVLLYKLLMKQTRWNFNDV